MDGLNRFVAGYQSRMQQVQAFNQRIAGGEAAVQRALGQIGLVLGAAALAKYSKDAREADRIQQQLNRTLQRTGETGAADALNEQASALQKVTNFSDESISTVQRLLISFGLTGKQALEMTESVLDLAQETGQSAESAAMLVGRTLRGETDELGRLNIKLDTTKGKVDSLRGSLQQFAAGAARGGVPDQTARSIEARYADATENLGRAVNRVIVPFLEALIPLLERVADVATILAAKLLPIAPMLGDMAAAVLPALVGFGLLSGGISAVMMVINPLRVAVMQFAGRSLVELSNALAKSTGGLSGLFTVLKNGGGTLAAFGSALAIAGSVVTAFFAGWSLGKLLGEVEAGGAKLKNWVSGTLLQIVANAVPIWGKIKEFFSVVSSGIAAFYLTLELGAKVALNPLNAKKARADYKAQISSLAAQATRELDDIRKETEAKVKEFSGMAADVVNDGRPGAGNAPAAAPVASPLARPDLNSGNFGDTTKADADRIKRLQAEDLFALETEILQAEAAGDKARVDRLKEYLRFKQLEAEMDGADYQLLQDRIAAEQVLDKQKLEREAAEQALSRRIAAGEAGLALIEQSRFYTQEQKDRTRVVLLEKINSLIGERIALLEKDQLRNPDQERQGKIDELRSTAGANSAAIEAATPLSMGQSMLAGMVQFLNDIPTLAQRAQQTIYGIANAFSSGVAGSITGLINRTMTWRDALLNIGQSVVASLIGAFANMAAQWIAKQIMMMLFGKALQVAQLAALAPIAASTALMWAPAATAASIATFGGAAVAGAAMAKAAILSSILGFATGGLIPGGEQLIRVNEGGRQESVLNARATSLLGAGFINAANAGADLASLSMSVAGQIPAAAAAGPLLGAAAGGDQVGGGAGNVRIFVHVDEAIGRAWLEKGNGKKILYRHINRDRNELGLES